MGNSLDALEAEFRDLETRYRETVHGSYAAADCDAFTESLEGYIARVNAYGRTLNPEGDHEEFVGLLGRLRGFARSVDDRFETVKGTKQANLIDPAMAAFPDTGMLRSSSEARWARFKKENQAQHPDVLEVDAGLAWSGDPAWRHAVGADPED